MNPQDAINDATNRSTGVLPALISFMKAQAEAFVARTYQTGTGEVTATTALSKINVTKIGTVNLAWELWFGTPWAGVRLLATWTDADGNGTMEGLLKANFFEWFQDQAFPPSAFAISNETERFYVTAPKTGTP